MTENNTQHAPVRAAAPTTLTAEEIKAQLTESGIPEHLHPYFPRGLGELIPAMGIKFQELTAERTVATMPVAGNTQPIGLLHGGANVVLAETLGSLSAGVHGGENLVAVGVDINATHVRPAVSGVVTATCTAVKLGRTLCIHSIDIVDERGRTTCTARITNMLIPRPTAERTVATMPVAGNTQPIGLLHGGANVVLAETLGSLSAGVHGGENLVAVGVDINATHVRPAVSGVVTATCTAVKLGRTLCIHSIDIVDERGRTTCTARITNMLIPRPTA